MTPFRLLLALVPITLAACGSDTAAPQPVSGDLTLNLTTPHTDDGALIIRINGQVQDVQPVGTYRVAFNTQGTLTRVIVTGDVRAGSLLTVRVPDVGKADSYSAYVEQAASGIDYALLSTAGYTLRLSPK